MAQPSITQYFNKRKRAATEDIKANSVRKVLVLDGSDASRTSTLTKNAITSDISSNYRGEVIKVLDTKLPERCVTPPNLTVKAPDKNLEIIKKKLLKSSKLNELKESIRSFKKSADQLKAAEKKTSEISSVHLKAFQSIEFEVPVSPQKIQSPEKPYLSPKKEPSARKNLLSVLSPTKHSSVSAFENYSKDVTDVTIKQGLKLPYKYRTLAEIFRAVDTVSQILYNRKETVTLRKLRPAVEEMLKKNLTEKHLAQIKFIFPDAYEYRQEKLRQFGAGTRQEEWNLVLIPNIDNAENMTSEILLRRRRTLYELLVELVKDYHNEFLLSLTPPMVIAKDKITRWHPEFDLEKVPDIKEADVPKPPVEEKLTTGKEVLEKARQLFNCNTRMEQALAKLKAKNEDHGMTEEKNLVQNDSLLKGIPKALLEKVRQKQAAKALLSMTRSADKEKEIQIYSRLPEIARLIRNLFVTEKKGVLPLDIVVEKLGNSYRCSLNKIELEDHLKTIAAEVPEWLVFHKIRNAVYLKLMKNADLSKILNKLEQLAKEKSES